LVKLLVLLNFVSEPSHIKILFPSPNELFPDCRFFLHQIGVPSPTLQAFVSSQSMHTSSFSPALESSPTTNATVNLPLLKASITTIVPLSNTHQVISLKFTNNNYIYLRMQMKPYLLGQVIFHFLMAHCRVLILMCFLLMVLLFRLILFFFIRSSMINLFSVHCFLLFQWMYCILLSIAKPRNVFGVLLTKPSFPCLIHVLYNLMGLYKIFVRVMIQSLYICRR